MKYLVLLFLLSACTAIDIDVTRPDGTNVKGTYFSTKTQMSPKFNFGKNDDNLIVSVETESSKGIDPADVANILNSVLEAAHP